MRSDRPADPFDRLYGCVTVQHDPRLALLACALCLFAILTALNLLDRAYRAESRDRWLWLTATAIAFGLAIWLLHFVSMLSYAARLGLPSGFVTGWIALSAITAIACSGCGVFVITETRLRDRFMFGGAIIGLGTAALHFIAMLGFKVPAILHFDHQDVLASLLVAVVLAALGAQVSSLRSGAPVLSLVAGVLLTLAIGGQHFIGMAAVTVEPSPLVPLPEGRLDADALALYVGSTACVIFVLGFGGTLVDRLWRQRSERETTRLRHLLDAAFEGIAILEEGRFKTANPALARLLGRDSAAQLEGGMLADCTPPATTSRLLGLVEHADERPHEGSLLRRDGEVVRVELQARRIEFEDRTARVLVVRDLTERRRAEARIRHLAHHDPLTDLPNRAYFKEHLEDALDRAAGSGSEVALLYLDLDRFKLVNDRYGHPAGDMLLQQVAARLSRAIRATDLAARLGGDEFAIVQDQAGDRSNIRAIAERLVKIIGEPYRIDGGSATVGVSIGIARFPEDAADADQLLRRADRALYAAKTGADGVCLFSSELAASAQAPLQVR